MSEQTIPVGPGPADGPGPGGAGAAAHPSPDGGDELIVPLGDSRAAGPERVGRKAHNLGRLLELGLQVPPGFVVTTAAWRAFAARADLPALPGSTAREELAELARAAALRCREAALPDGLEAAIDAGLALLGPGPVAVRSSALDEDACDLSAAGLFQTTLGCVGRQEVLDAVRHCWASLLSAPALAYRLDRGATGPEPAMAVIVQRMLVPRAAGVLFTPVEGDDGPLIVEAVPGPGVGLVEGTLNPERHELPRSALRSGRLPEAWRGSRLLTAGQLTALVGAASSIEAALGRGVDLEWALSGDELQLLQARPVTRAARAGGQGRIRWTAANTQEALLDPVTPLTWSFFVPLVEGGRRDLFRFAGLEEIPGPGYMRLFQGMPYFNPEYFRAFLQQVPGAPPNIFDALIFGEGSAQIAFRPEEFRLRTLRLVALFALARLAARERFEVFLRLFRARLRWLTPRDLTRLSDEELLQLRTRATGLLDEALRRHVLGTAISGAAYLLLDAFLGWTGAAAAFPEGLVARLTAGASGNALGDANALLEDMAREARGAAPRLAEVLERAAGRHGPGALAALSEAGAAGRRLGRQLERFLRRFGHRGEKEAELAEPRWGDDPAVLLAVLASYVRAEGAAGPEGLRVREERLSERARLLGRRVSGWLGQQGGRERLVPLRRLAFRLLLREARRYAPYRENLKDQALRALHLIRRVALEGGQRLARRGLLEAPDDVFFLELAELEAALRGELGPELGPRAAARRAERQGQLGREAPRYVVDVPGAPPRPVYVRGAVGNLIEGVGASGGKVTARARVLRSVEEAARLGAGEILVARVINAGWTPLFHLAGGIVAEVGGVLSHAAIVAREYGLPAVFGAEGAGQIADGALVTVDGDLGIVTIEM